MKNIYIILLLVVAGAAAQTGKVTFRAEIKNPNSDSLEISSRKFKKVIRADGKGKFAALLMLNPACIL